MPFSPRQYRTMEEFEREELRPSYRIGFSFSDLVEDSAFEEGVLFDNESDFDADEDVEEDEDDEDLAEND